MAYLKTNILIDNPPFRFEEFVSLEKNTKSKRLENEENFGSYR